MSMPLLYIKEKIIKITLDAEVVWCCFFTGFLTNFGEFSKRANLGNQAKTMEGWSKMHFPMLRLGSNVDNRNTEFEDTIIFGDHVSGELFLLNISIGCDKVQSF